MVLNRLKTIVRHVGLHTKALSLSMAKGYWIIPVYISCCLTAFVISHSVTGPAPVTTTHGAVVHTANVQTDRTTYYPASFEPNDYKPLQGERTMSFNKKQLREKITAVLTWLEPEIPFSDTAVELLMLTCAQETHLGKYLKQVKGPARGIFQIEPNTEKDMMKSLQQSRNTNLRQKIGELMHPAEGVGFTNMEMNLAYQIAMARYYYYRIPKQLPDSTIEAMAMYWKKYYNTYLGAGTPQEAVHNYKRYCV